MTLAQRLRSIVTPMPDDGAVTLSVASLRAWLAEEPNTAPDLELDQLREHHFPKVSVSTLREWCSKGLFPHAYKQRGRVWLVPPCCVGEFKEGQRNAVPAAPASAPIAPRRHRASPNRAPVVHPDIGAWRNVK